jgi:imidazolonepropionase-like amidohydrolase
MRPRKVYEDPEVSMKLISLPLLAPFAALFALCAITACSAERPARTSPAPRGGAAVAPVTTRPCTAVRNARVFDGERVITSASVVFEDGRITEVRDAAATLPCSTVVDGTGKTLLPGLIDAHAHVWEESQLASSLRFGVTTVLDMMTDPKAAVALRGEASRRPELADLRSAGNPVTAKGGHGTEYGLTIETIERPEDADRFVEARIAEGSDYLKIIYTPDSPLFHSISRDVLVASVAAAHRRHVRTVVHIDTLRGAQDALEAGADGLAHLFWDTSATKELVLLAKSRGAFVVPTLSVLSTVAGKPHGPELLRDAELSSKLGDADAKMLKATFPVQMRVDAPGIPASVAALHAAGVPILAGTDAPNPGTAHGISVHGELELLALAGLSPAEALAAATAAPARAFGLTDRGRIAPGLRADLLLVEGNPSADIRATRRIAAIWRGGVRLADGPPPQARHEEAPPAATEVPKRGPGLISDFEGAEIDSRFGLGWKESTDQIMGGSSVATIARLHRGVRSAHSLSVTGEVTSTVPFAWSGVMFNPGDKLFAPVDVSAAKELVFSTRGDGKSYAVLVFTRRRGQNPSRQAFVASKAWKTHHLALSAFDGCDGTDVVGLAFVAGPRPGKYAFELDDVALR